MLSRLMRSTFKTGFSYNSTRPFYSTKTQLPPLVSGEWLQSQLQRENVKIVDGSFHLPEAQRDAAKEFSQQRIPGATFFDMTEIRDKSTKLPRMMPSAQDFEVAMSQIGLKHDDIIIVYDCAGMFSSPRCWYMLKSMGAKNVSVLNGGFPSWKKAGRPIEDGPMTGAYQKETSAFSAKFNKQSFANYRDMNRIVAGVAGNDDVLIVDARSMERFAGNIDEGPGKKAGHIPTSINLFYKRLFKEDGIHFKEVKELKQVFADRKIDYTKPIVTTCGSGVTAAIINFAIACIQYEKFDDELDEGFQPLRLYDGSWAEWGSREDSRVATQPVEDQSEKFTSATHRSHRGL